MTVFISNIYIYKLRLFLLTQSTSTTPSTSSIPMSTSTSMPMPTSTYTVLGDGDVESPDETVETIETAELLDTSNTRNQTAYSCSIKLCSCVVLTILVMMWCILIIHHSMNHHDDDYNREGEYICTSCGGECWTSCSTCTCIMVRKDCVENSTYIYEPCWRDTYDTKLVELNFFSQHNKLCGGPNIACGL